jgi:hypothetical protein
VLALVSLLQELLALSTAVSPKQPLSKACALLVSRLPVDWAALHVISTSGAVVMQVRVRAGVAVCVAVCVRVCVVCRGSPQHPRHTTPRHATPARQRHTAAART